MSNQNELTGLSNQELQSMNSLEHILFARTSAIVTTIMDGIEARFTEKADKIEARLTRSNSKNPRPNRFELGQISAFEEIYSGLQQFLILEQQKVQNRLNKIEEEINNLEETNE